MPPQPLDDPLLFVFFNEIGIINQLAQQRLEQTFPSGFKMSHFSVLNHFVRLGGEWRPSRLARSFQVTKGAMTNTLSWLSKQGYVEIRVDPKDKRVKLVQITDAGCQMREQAIEAVSPILQEIAHHFPDTEIEKALPVLQGMRQYLDHARDTDS